MTLRGFLRRVNPFVCHHKKITFPYGKRGEETVFCWNCKKDLHYDWERMRIDESQKNTKKRSVEKPSQGAKSEMVIEDMGIVV